MTTRNLPESALEAVARALTHFRQDDDWDLDTRAGRKYREVMRAKARAALTAALPHLRPTVTTEAELDALPVDSVVRDTQGFVYEKRQDDDDPEFPWWAMTGDSRQYARRKIHAPATVLYRGADA